jgi:hypothetical protein
MKKTSLLHQLPTGLWYSKETQQLDSKIEYKLLANLNLKTFVHLSTSTKLSVSPLQFIGLLKNSV